MNPQIVSHFELAQKNTILKVFSFVFFSFVKFKFCWIGFQFGSEPNSLF